MGPSIYQDEERLSRAGAGSDEKAGHCRNPVWATGAGRAAAPIERRGRGQCVQDDRRVLHLWHDGRGGVGSQRRAGDPRPDFCASIIRIYLSYGVGIIDICFGITTADILSVSH